MGKGKGYCAVCRYLVRTDKFQRPGTFVVIVQACPVSGIFFAKAYGKHRGKTELPFIGEADLDAVALSGDMVHDVYRHCVHARLNGKINVSRPVCRDALSVNAPEDAVSHVKGDDDVPALETVKNIPWDYCGAVHIHVDGAAFLRPSSRTPLTLTVRICPKPGDYLYLKTVYTPVRLYADGKLIFAYGQDGDFPAFLLDPPTKTALVPLPETGHEVTLTLEYLSPSQRDAAALHPLLLGSPDQIVAGLFSEMGFSLFFSVFLLALGLIMVLVSLIFLRFGSSGTAFFWLGLFSLCTGAWSFGECNLTGLLVGNAPILYLMAFLGLFTFAIPLLRFILVVLRPHAGPFLEALCAFMVLCVCGAAALQLFGVVSLLRSMYLFHVLTPACLCILAGTALWESIRFQNRMARRLLWPMAVLALFALLEVANYYLFRLDVQKSFFFQVGVLVFVTMVSIQCGYFMAEALALLEENHRLEKELSLLERQARMQEEHYRRITEASPQEKQQRHDFRHHTAALRRLLEKGETHAAAVYLDALIAPSAGESLPPVCQNETVNAVALHYLDMAVRSGVTDCSIRLEIPEDTGSVPAHALCVVVGNLLENAVAACAGADAPFIRMRGRLADGILTIVMDNRYASVSRMPEGGFLSGKPGGGIGLLSVRSIAEKYGGGCRFEAEDTVFSSSVYLRLS